MIYLDKIKKHFPQKALINMKWLLKKIKIKKQGGKKINQAEKKGWVTFQSKTHSAQRKKNILAFTSNRNTASTGWHLIICSPQTCLCPRRLSHLSGISQMPPSISSSCHTRHSIVLSGFSSSRAGSDQKPKKQELAVVLKAHLASITIS